jgi:L-iditol 2-dehydrogenase
MDVIKLVPEKYLIAFCSRWSVKALVLKGKGRVGLEEIAEPNLEEGEILVKMHACGICGTDIEKVKGEAITPPVLGHEVVGEVYKVANRVSQIKHGERVFAHHHAPCYSCSLCKKGEFTLCDEFPKHNIRPGGFAEFYAVPRWNIEREAVLKLPDSLPYEIATFIEPLGCCIRGFRKVWKEGCETAVIYGSGPTGMTFLKLLKMNSCKVVVADISEYRRNYAERSGAVSSFDPRDEERKIRALEILGKQPEIAIVATGSVSAFSDALKTVSKAGRVLLFGSPPAGSFASVDMPNVFLKGISLFTSYSTSEIETREALKMLSEGRIELGDLITHRFRLDEAVKAFEIAQDQKCIKAIITN